MGKFPRTLRQIFRPMTPRSSAIERGLLLISILAAVILATMALVVYRINSDAADAARRSIRSIEAASTLDKLQLALRDVDMAARELSNGRNRDRSDVERYDGARFQARLNLAALGPLAGDEPAQIERLSRLGPLINAKFAHGLRSYESPDSASRDEIDNLIAAMRVDEGARLERFRAAQSDASEKSTTIMVGALTLVTLLSLGFWILLKTEFRARRVLERRLIESATTDELTGAANRSEFDRKLVQEWAFRARYATALSLLIVDVDRLKAINDQWGHLAGDAVLREVARRISSRVRRSEVVARSGGDQFAVIVPNYRKEAVDLAEQLRERMAEAPFSLQSGGRTVPVEVTVSVGVAEASDVGSARELLIAAEEAMYAAKGSGRNRVESYRSAPTTPGIHVGPGTVNKVSTASRPTTVF